MSESKSKEACRKQTPFLKRGKPLVSVVIPTFNREQLLARALEALSGQTLPRLDFEVIVVDDGSTQEQTEIVGKFQKRLVLGYIRIPHSGISSAKNAGLLAAAAPVVVFLDDDDVARPTLLEQHLMAHESFPEESVAVLGYTIWSPSLELTPVMRYVTDVGRLLFSYGDLRDGQRLDFRYFWGGRSSAKRRYLLENGLFDPRFTRIIEDVELGYRLSTLGLTVLYRRSAVSYMSRGVTFGEFCERCETRGKALGLFSEIHDDQEVRDYCRVAEAMEAWSDRKELLANACERVAAIESELSTGPRRKDLEDELFDLYGWTFETYEMRGIVNHFQPVCGLT